MKTKLWLSIPGGLRLGFFFGRQGGLGIWGLQDFRIEGFGDSQVPRSKASGFKDVKLPL